LESTASRGAAAPRSTRLRRSSVAHAVLEDLRPQPGDEVLAFVNGLGATPQIELYIAYRELAAICAGAGLRVARSLVGSYVTALDMAGCAVTLLRLDDELKRLWDAPVHTAALRWGM
jgi:dihydroxyacetone kinase-like protein